MFYNTMRKTAIFRHYCFHCYKLQWHTLFLSSAFCCCCCCAIFTVNCVYRKWMKRPPGHCLISFAPQCDTENGKYLCISSSIYPASLLSAWYSRCRIEFDKNFATVASTTAAATIRLFVCCVTCLSVCVCDVCVCVVVLRLFYGFSHFFALFR